LPAQAIQEQWLQEDRRGDLFALEHNELRTRNVSINILDVMNKDDQITLRVPSDLKQRLKQFAREDDRTFAYLARKILSDWIKKRTSPRHRDG
jgi:hypothetical protein